MYDELVKALRICEVGEHCDLCPKWDDKQNGGKVLVYRSHYHPAR